MTGRAIWAMLDDLEQQAEGLALQERDVEVADRSQAEYAAVRMAARLHALAGRRVRLSLLGGLSLAARVERTGADWMLLDDGSGSTWLVPHDAIGMVHGADPRAVADEAIGVVRRLSLRSVLRGLADAGVSCAFHLRDGARADGRITRVGADFVESFSTGDGTETGGGVGVSLLPFAALAAVQTRA